MKILQTLVILCEICGKEYEGKNESMNKLQHMIHHFKEKLYQNLPPRHYGSVYKVVDKMLKQYMEEHPEAWGNQLKKQRST